VLDAIRAQDSATAARRMAGLLSDTRERLLKPARSGARKAAPATARRAAAR